MKVLLIEDDAETTAYIVNGFTEEGLVVDHAKNGRDGLVLAAGVDDRVEGLEAGGDAGTEQMGKAVAGLVPGLVAA